MAISRRADYVYKDVLLYDDLNRWSINGSPQYLTQTTMAGATLQLFNGVFDLSPENGYKNFKVIISDFRTSIGGLVLNMKLAQNASVPAATYDQAYTQQASSGGIAYFGGTGLAAWTILRNTNTTNCYAAIVDVFSPVHDPGTAICQMSKISGDGNGWSTSSGRVSNTNSYNGFELSLSGAGTMSGTVTIYALRSGSA